VPKKMAAERIALLFELALSEACKGNEARARRYIYILRAINTHYKVGLPIKVKNGTCKRCNRVLVPGTSAKVRISGSKGQIIYSCICGRDRRIFFKTTSARGVQA